MLDCVLASAIRPAARPDSACRADGRGLQRRIMRRLQCLPVSMAGPWGSALVHTAVGVAFRQLYSPLALRTLAEIEMTPIMLYSTTRNK